MPKISLDAFDWRLLRALQSDGRLTAQELAESVGLSASQCARRRQALEEAGIITGYSARLDAEALGLGVTAFIQVTLSPHSPENARRFAAFIGRLEEAQEAFSLTGSADYLIKANLADLKALGRLVNEELLAQPGVAQVRSFIALERLKEGAGLPLPRG